MNESFLLIYNDCTKHYFVLLILPKLREIYILYNCILLILFVVNENIVIKYLIDKK